MVIYWTSQDLRLHPALGTLSTTRTSLRARVSRLSLHLTSLLSLQDWKAPHPFPELQHPRPSKSLYPTSQVTPQLLHTVGRPSVTPIFPQRGGPHLSSPYRGSPGLVPSPQEAQPSPSPPRKPLYPTFFDDPLSGPLIPPYHSESVTPAYLSGHRPLPTRSPWPLQARTSCLLGLQPDTAGSTLFM